jgi:hypothetical protein
VAAAGATMGAVSLSIGLGVSAAPFFSARTCQVGWTDTSSSCPSAPRLSAVG